MMIVHETPAGIHVVLSPKERDALIAALRQSPDQSARQRNIAAELEESRRRMTATPEE